MNRQRFNRVWIAACIAAVLPLTACVSPGAIGEHAVEPTTRIGGPLLTPWQTMKGGQLEGGTAPGAGQYLTFGRPVAVSAQGNDVYIADGARQRIFRFDRARQTLSEFYRIPPAVKLYAAPDRSLFVVDPAGGQVLQIGPEGALMHTFRDAANLARPVAVSVDEARGRVLIADGMYNHILVFNRLGTLTGVIVPRDGASERLRGIRAMALGPDGLYVMDGLERRVVVIGPAGGYRYSFGENSLVDPVAIAVDQYRRAFVADAFGNSIKVFAQGREVAVSGGTGVGPGFFTHITDLCLDEGLLYVTDGGSGAVQIMQVAPGTPAT